MTPRGGWTANSREAEWTTTDPRFEAEVIELRHAETGARGQVIIGLIMGGAGGVIWNPDEAGDVHPISHERLNVERKTDFDTPGLPAYITEQIASYDAGQGRRYAYVAQLVTDHGDGDLLPRTGFMPQDSISTPIYLTHIPQESGATAKAKVDDFLKTQARKDALDILRNMKYTP